MRLALLGGVSLAILATTPALAQQPVSNAAIVARLNALEAKVDSLEARNADLEHQLAAQKSAAAAPAPYNAPASSALASASPVPGGTSGSTAPLPSASSGGADVARAAPKPVQAFSLTIVPQFN